MLRIFSCDLKLARLEDVVTLQDSWHVARCLKRFTTLSTDDRVIIFGGEWGSVGGEVGWGGGGGKLLYDTQSHCRRKTVRLCFGWGGRGARWDGGRKVTFNNALLTLRSDLSQITVTLLLMLCSEFSLVTCYRCV